MPDQDRELAGRSDGRHLMPASVADPQKKRPQRPRRLRRRPRRLDQQGAGMRATVLADPAMLSQTETRLTDARVEAKVADQFLRLLETGDVADRRDDAAGHDRVDAGDGQQALHAGVAHRFFRDSRLKLREILPKAIDLADVSCDRRAFVARQFLPGQPVAPASVEQIGMRTPRNQIRLKNGVHLVLHARAMPNNLVATGDKPAKPFGSFVGRPHFW